MLSQRAAAWSAFLLISTCAHAGVTTTVVDVPTRGVNQRFLYVHPDAPRVNIIDLFGGTGNLGIQDDGSFSNPAGYCNPVVRVREALADHGYAIAFVDITSDARVRNYVDVLEVIRYMQARDNVPTWVIGGDTSAQGAANIVGQLPVAYPAGAIFHAPDMVSAPIAALVKRPSLVVWQALDTAQFGAALYAGLTAAPTKEQIILSGGSDVGCGYHRFNGIDAEFAAAIEGFIDRINPALVGIANYEGLFYNAPAESEAGWGINLAQQGSIIFGTWFTYDTTGKGWWLTLITETNPSPGVYTAGLYATTGPPFNATPFVKTSSANKVGTATLNFTDASNGTFHYEINLPGGTVSQTKAITQQQFAAPPLASCASATTPLTAATNYQDIWWAGTSTDPGTEQGWGINFTHQGDLIFASWFTYDLDGTPLWVVAIAPKTAPGVYEGDLYRPSGPRFDAYDKNQWTPNAPVGSLTLTFADGNNATMDYTLLGIGPQHKIITRQVFSGTGTACK